MRHQWPVATVSMEFHRLETLIISSFLIHYNTSVCSFPFFAMCIQCQHRFGSVNGSCFLDFDRDGKPDYEVCMTLYDSHSVHNNYIESIL